MNEYALTQAEAAQAIGVSSLTLHNWRERKVGPRYFVIGKRVRYAQRELDDFIRRGVMELLEGRRLTRMQDIGDYKTTAQVERVKKIRISDECRALHPFIVFRPTDIGVQALNDLLGADDNADDAENILGHFASMYCAASTALFDRTALVRDERTGQVYQRGFLATVNVQMITPIEWKGTLVGGRIGNCVEAPWAAPSYDNRKVS